MVKQRQDKGRQRQEGNRQRQEGIKRQPSERSQDRQGGSMSTGQDTDRQREREDADR